ncbi:MAG TPA: hypothetical protein VN851_05360 [Thermoanaerobaculia bacterium]|nr:hypothetical protein [Thermoanaerobaculia bacterium]
MNRDLGTLGENILSSWAAARRISAQKATIDVNGWDFLLEFPRTSGQPSLPADKEPAHICCLVQVKATSTGKLNCQVALATWQRLAISPFPAFFLILDFGAADVPRAAYLVPLDAARIGRVLKRIRELDSSPVGTRRIARHTMSVDCGEDNKLESPNGESLERSILSHIGSSFEKYIQEKLALVETTGYETASGHFTFTVEGESLGEVDLGEYLVDLSLGLRVPLAVSSAKFYDVRFSIPAREPSLDLPEGELEIIPGVPVPVEVILRLGILAVRVNMDMLLPGGLGVLPIDLIKIRLKSKVFEFVVSNSRPFLKAWILARVKISVISTVGRGLFSFLVRSPDAMGRNSSCAKTVDQFFKGSSKGVTRFCPELWRPPRSCATHGQ